MTGDFAEKRLFWRETDTAPFHQLKNLSPGDGIAVPA